MRAILRVCRPWIVASLLVAAAGWTLATPRSEVHTIADVPAEVSWPEEFGAGDAALMINNCTYYNNANHSRVVGQFGYDCCNNPVAWGKKTAYKDCGGCFPCFPPPQ
jgi:hypothetical protein